MSAFDTMATKPTSTETQRRTMYSQQFCLQQKRHQTILFEPKGLFVWEKDRSGCLSLTPNSQQRQIEYRQLNNSETQIFTEVAFPTRPKTYVKGPSSSYWWCINFEIQNKCTLIYYFGLVTSDLSRMGTPNMHFLSGTLYILLLLVQKELRGKVQHRVD